MEAALEGKGYFLAGITAESSGTGEALGDTETHRRLDEMTVDTGVQSVNRSIPDGGPSGVQDSVIVSTPIQIESVEVTVDISHPVRGQLEVVLTSPTGTESILAERHGDEAAGSELLDDLYELGILARVHVARGIERIVPATQLSRRDAEKANEHDRAHPTQGRSA